MDAFGINMTFRKAKWPDLLKESKLAKLQMWGLGWSSAIPDADGFFVMLYGPNGGQERHAGKYEGKAGGAFHGVPWPDGAAGSHAIMR